MLFQKWKIICSLLSYKATNLSVAPMIAEATLMTQKTSNNIERVITQSIVGLTFSFCMKLIRNNLVSDRSCGLLVFSSKFS